MDANCWLRELVPELNRVLRTDGSVDVGWEDPVLVEFGACTVVDAFDAVVCVVVALPPEGMRLCRCRDVMKGACFSWAI